MLKGLWKIKPRRNRDYIFLTFPARLGRPLATEKLVYNHFSFYSWAFFIVLFPSHFRFHFLVPLPHAFACISGQPFSTSFFFCAVVGYPVRTASCPRGHFVWTGFSCPTTSLSPTRTLERGGGAKPRLLSAFAFFYFFEQRFFLCIAGA